MRPEDKTTRDEERRIKEGRTATSTALVIFGIMLLCTGLLDTLFTFKTGVSSGPLNYVITAGGIGLIMAGKKL